MHPISTGPRSVVPPLPRGRKALVALPTRKLRVRPISSSRMHGVGLRLLPSPGADSFPLLGPYSRRVHALQARVVFSADLLLRRAAVLDHKRGSSAKVDLRKADSSRPIAFAAVRPLSPESPEFRGRPISSPRKEGGGRDCLAGPGWPCMPAATPWQRRFLHVARALQLTNSGPVRSWFLQCRSVYVLRNRWSRAHEVQVSGDRRQGRVLLRPAVFFWFYSSRAGV